MALLDYVQNQVFLFGKYGRTTDDTLYASWDRSSLWNAIADGLGWVTEDKEPSAFNLGWVQVCELSHTMSSHLMICQVGVEAGPQMAAVVHHVLENGWHVPQIISQFGAPGTLTHLMWERVFHQVLKASHKYYRIWYMSEDQETYDVTPPQWVLDYMMTQPHKYQWVREIALRLDAKDVKVAPSAVSRRMNHTMKVLMPRTVILPLVHSKGFHTRCTGLYVLLSQGILSDEHSRLLHPSIYTQPKVKVMAYQHLPRIPMMTLMTMMMCL